MSFLFRLYYRLIRPIETEETTGSVKLMRKSRATFKLDLRYCDRMRTSCGLAHVLIF